MPSRSVDKMFYARARARPRVCVCVCVCLCVNTSYKLNMFENKRIPTDTDRNTHFLFLIFIPTLPQWAVPLYSKHSFQSAVHHHSHSSLPKLRIQSWDGYRDRSRLKYVQLQPWIRSFLSEHRLFVKTCLKIFSLVLTLKKKVIPTAKEKRWRQIGKWSPFDQASLSKSSAMC